MTEQSKTCEGDEVRTKSIREEVLRHEYDLLQPVINLLCYKLYETKDE